MCKQAGLWRHCRQTPFTPHRHAGDDVGEELEAAGHSPDARSAQWRANLRPDGRFRDPAELRAHYRRLGVGEDGGGTIVYCGSGTSACHDLLALEVAGLTGARLYPGSWREWSAAPGAPVARRAAPPCAATAP